ncbi:MAG: hypothetical protein COA58_15560 [Bacteroidetes bacterium]|nr:MAG: hypothetical protein COA58_15560 [Bacteroidota bacterium]
MKTAFFNKSLTFYAILASVVLVSTTVFQSYAQSSHLSFESYTIAIALIFFAIGFVITKGSVNRTEEEVSSASQESVNFEELSVRENEILHLIVAGHSNKEIASQIFVSLSTVKTHIYSIYKKMHVNSRPQLMLKVIKTKDFHTKVLGDNPT